MSGLGRGGASIIPPASKAGSVEGECRLDWNTGDSQLDAWLRAHIEDEEVFGRLGQIVARADRYEIARVLRSKRQEVWDLCRYAHGCIGKTLRAQQQRSGGRHGSDGLVTAAALQAVARPPPPSGMPTPARSFVASPASGAAQPVVLPNVATARGQSPRHASTIAAGGGPSGNDDGQLMPCWAMAALENIPRRVYSCERCFPFWIPQYQPL